MAVPISGRLILASASPRRLELLGQIGVVPFRVEPADLDETPHGRELPADYAVRLAQDKATAIASRFPGAYILAADTVVAVGRRILGKPRDITDARSFLQLLSGRRHRVIGGVAVVDPEGRVRSRATTSVVRFRRLTESDIASYVASDEWRDKAGGYAIQGHAAVFIAFISGSYSNIVGLPLFETAGLLAGAGFRAEPSR